MLTYEEPKAVRELEEKSRAFAYDKYPWRVVVASESYKSGYKAAIREANKQVRRAKEIIKVILEEEKDNMYWEMNGFNKSKYYKVRKQAEQFLKEVL